MLELEARDSKKLSFPGAMLRQSSCLAGALGYQIGRPAAPQALETANGNQHSEV